MIADSLTFDADSHTYRLDGIVVPSVTRILQPLLDFSRIRPDVLAAKADLGRRVHTACHFDDESDLDESSVEEDVAPYLAAYRRFRAESGAEILHAELLVFHPLSRYAGRLDRVLRLNGERWLVDLKTSITNPNSVGPQTAAYLHALGDPSVVRRAALRLRPDRTYRLDPLTDPDDTAVFQACLTIHRHLEKHA